LVTGIIKNAFKSKILIPSAYTQEKKEIPKSEQTTLVLDERTKDIPVTKEVTWERPVFSGPTIQEKTETIKVNIEPVPPKAEVENDHQNWEFEETDPEPIESERYTAVTHDEEKIESRIPRLYPIGQMHGTYIFAQNENGLYIIDQHAAQERLKYEYFREKVGQVQAELQELLVPITLDYSTDEYLKINENRIELEKVGVFLEEFGLNSYIVRSHPQWFPKGEEKQIIEDMIEQLLSMKKVDIKKLREEAAIMMSCKASIKANRHLRNDEIQALLDDLRKASDPFTCPHGRPIIVHYSSYEMEKMFKRVM
jgi:DNA mismatch repair protein MutL